mmetsp:Transcript_10799/g.15229  ORF Transcript_10799/g.15229 Transcript_10799/m.15229 type:complete len:698 (-) Transcript_10799:169-2262(-)
MKQTSSSGTPNPLLRPLEKTLSPNLLAKVRSSRILLVGSGGIGCELLKNLALSGFNHVEVIDLDTIDVSNLNRQFLFRGKHVGMPKCQVACEVSSAMAIDILNETISENKLPVKKKAIFKAHHGNICDNTRFNVPFLKSFDLVLNALDNVTARRRVNRLCLAASIPLVEAGTTGYLGQVTVIDKASEVECYECASKPTRKVYPICTIRSTPSQPVHCIVWAKELYKLIFGDKIEESMLFEDDSLNGGSTKDTSEDEKNEDKEMNSEIRSTYMYLVNDIRDMIFAKSGIVHEKITEKVGELLTALFSTEIIKQLAMDRYKTSQKVPVPISPSDIITAVNQNPLIPPTKTKGYKHTDVWSIEECAAELLSCLIDAHATLQTGNIVVPEFDKDDTMSMRFVTAATNLRSQVFSIEPLQSYYTAKGIAGNIIPAIATTNAIVAGLQVLQTFSILKNIVEGKHGVLKESCKYTYCLRDKTRKGYFLQPTTLPDPNPKCFVCRNASVDVILDVNKWNFQKFLDIIVKERLGFMEPSIMIGESIVHEEGDGADDDSYQINLSKKLVDLPAGGIKHGTIVKIEDFTQDLEIDLNVSHNDEWQKEEGSDGDKGNDSFDGEWEKEFIIGDDKSVLIKKPSLDENGGKVESKIKDDDEIDIIINNNEKTTPRQDIKGINSTHPKRKAEDMDSDLINGMTGNRAQKRSR